MGMRVYEIRFRSVIEYVVANTSIEAIQVFCEDTKTDLFSINPLTPMRIVGHKSWKEITFETVVAYDSDGLEITEKETLVDIMKEIKTAQYIGSELVNNLPPWVPKH